MIGGIVPNSKSNIHPILLGIIFAVLFTKIVFGDYDIGYQMTYLDIVFISVTALEGAVGALISNLTFGNQW